MLLITVVSGPDQGRTFKLPDGQTHTLGRRHGSVPLEDHRVSRRHLKLRPSPAGGWTATDLASSNGSFLNQIQLPPNAPAELHNGDTLQLGRSLLNITFTPAGITSPGSVAIGPVDDDFPDGDPASSSANLDPAVIAAIQQSLAELRDSVAQLASRPAPPTPPPLPTPPAVDPQLREQIAELRSTVADLARRVSDSAPTDGLRREVESLRRTVEQLPAPPQPIDPTPALDQLLTRAEGIPQLRTAVEELPAKIAPGAELDQLRAALAALPAQLDTREALAGVRAAVEALPATLVAASGGEIAHLSAAIETLPEILDPRSNFEELRNLLNALPQPPDLRPALERLQAALEKLPAQISVSDELAALRESLASLPAPPDVRPELAALRTALEKLPSQISTSDELAALRESLAGLPSAPDPRPELEALRAAVQKLAAEPPRDETVASALAEIHQQLKILATTPPPPPPAPPITVEHPEFQIAAERLIGLLTARPDTEPQIVRRLDELLEHAHRPGPDLAGELASLRTELAGLAKRDDLAAAIAPLITALESAPAPPASIDPAEFATQREQLEAIRAAIAAIPAAPHAAELVELKQNLEALRVALAEKPAGIDPAEFAEQREQLEAIHAALTADSQGAALAEVRAEVQRARAAVEALPGALDGAEDLRRALEPIGDAVRSLAEEPRAREVAERVAKLAEDWERSRGGVERRLEEVLVTLRSDPQAPPLEQKIDQVLALLLSDRSAELSRKLDDVVNATIAAAHSNTPEQLVQLRLAIDTMARRLDGPQQTLERRLDALREAIESSRSSEEGHGETAALLREVRDRLGAAEPAGGVATLDADTAATLGRVAAQLERLGDQPGPERAMAELFELLRAVQSQQERQADRLRRVLDRLDAIAAGAGAARMEVEIEPRRERTPIELDLRELERAKASGLALAAVVVVIVTAGVLAVAMGAGWLRGTVPAMTPTAGVQQSASVGGR